jgi:hypothetical protein
MHSFLWECPRVNLERQVQIVKRRRTGLMFEEGSMTALVGNRNITKQELDRCSENLLL